ncbi:cytochrome b/b6 domain-containing protein [Arthrobacter sp. EpRS71]|uniref:cytochrome b/b6 domain-containing protein n=1 Tax=Arthrobacter sp. EpRS71 TaxID=1743141 RepID=UPI001E5D7B8A|nr:cytochrome b/b6 domain-containing protein [Arthrobacter sp. EpRS71]
MGEAVPEASSLSHDQEQHPGVPQEQVTQTGGKSVLENGVANKAVRQEGVPGSMSRRWKGVVLKVLGVAVVTAAIVLLARWARTTQPVMDFLSEYPGHTEPGSDAPTGIPAWVNWQHFLNIFFLVLIVRTGLQVRLEKRPAGYWTPAPGSFFAPKGNARKKVSLAQWLHQCLDVLWILNGLIFIILLFTTGRWTRIVPTSWDILPNAASAAVQYASLNWPAENGWVYYNALQVLAYFLTVFVAAPLAIISGIRMSTWWPDNTKASRFLTIDFARALHFPVMLYFAGFTVIHVLLVFLTGALENLNHMFTARSAADWLGLLVFLASVLVIAAAWFLTKPVFTTPLASKMGKVSR